jgi:hypothetical protein
MNVPPFELLQKSGTGLFLPFEVEPYVIQRKSNENWYQRQHLLGSLGTAQSPSCFLPLIVSPQPN